MQQKANKKMATARSTFCVLPLTWALIYTGSASAALEKASLTLSPEQCVALTRGQACYFDATLEWRTPSKGDYCLYSSEQEAPLFCWQQQDRGRFKRELAVEKNAVFSLRVKGSNEIKATRLLKVTWVHQKRGQPRMWWRIF